MSLCTNQGTREKDRVHILFRLSFYLWTWHLIFELNSSVSTCIFTSERIVWNGPLCVFQDQVWLTLYYLFMKYQLFCFAYGYGFAKEVNLLKINCFRGIELEMSLSLPSIKQSRKLKKLPWLLTITCVMWYILSYILFH